MKRTTIAALLAGALLAGAAQAAILTATNSTPGSVDAGLINSPCHGLEECFIERSVTFAEHGLVEDVDLDVLFWFFYNEGTLSLRHGGVTVDAFQNFRSGQIHPEGRYGITLDDEAVEILPRSCEVWRCFADRFGSFRPDSPLAAFDGLDAFGVWTLIVGDWDSGDPTSINAFTLRVTVPELGRTVPEPDSFALMLAGLGALGWALRGKHG